MTQFHGKQLQFSIYDSGAVLRDISAHVMSVDFPRSVDTVDIATADGSGDHKYMAGLRNATITLNLVWDDTLTTGPDLILAGLLGTAPSTSTSAGGWQFKPNPSASGATKVTYSGAGCVTAYNVSASVSDAVKATATIQCHGAITRAVA